MQCKRRTSGTTSSVSVSFSVRRQDVESSRLNLQRSFKHNAWQWRPALLSAVTFFVSFNSGTTICHGMPHKTSQFIGSKTSLSAPNCTCSIMMTNRDFLSHTSCKRADNVFSNFTKPNFPSQLRHWLSLPSTSSPHFTRPSVFANSHFVHDLRYKMKTSTE